MANIVKPTVPHVNAHGTETVSKAVAFGCQIVMVGRDDGSWRKPS